jgi:phage tail-like protein
LNPIQTGGITGQMLGFLEPPPSAEVLPLRMYDFLIEPIRLKDKHEGNLFVERFLEGGQSIWELTQASIFALKKLWSVTECPDIYLQYLKNIVGWTKELDYITDELDEEALRRLISVSVPMWKKRGAESTIKEVVNVALPSRLRIWNWFDFRWMTDETAFDEQRQGRDSWLFPFPGSPTLQEYWSVIRVVDPGTDGRELFKDIVKLMRPVSERYEIIYLKFLDLFEVDGDLSQWNNLLAETATVEDGVLKLPEKTVQGGVTCSIDGSSEWSNYVVSARIRGTKGSLWEGFGIIFYWDEETGDGYGIHLDLELNAIGLDKFNSFVGVGFEYYYFSPYELQENVWYGIRVQLSPEGSGLRIKVYVDGEERINVVEAVPVTTKGTIGIAQTANVSMECDEIEVLGLPVESETIEINS